MKLFKLQANKDVRKYNFTARVVDVWNSLPESVIESTSVNAFKSSLDKHWRKQDVLINYKAKINTGYRKALL